MNQIRWSKEREENIEDLAEADVILRQRMEKEDYQLLK